MGEGSNRLSWDRLDFDEIRRRLEGGETRQSIAAELGVSHQRLYYRIKHQIASVKRDVKPLTAEQQKLVEKFMHLAEACAKRKFRPGLDYDVLYSQACMGLVEAARQWDESRTEAGCWGPYAVQRINWYLLRLWEKRYTDSHFLESPEKQFPENADEFALVDKRERSKTVELTEEVAAVIKSLPPQQQAVIMMTAAYGVRHADAAVYMGLTRNRVTKIYQEARQKLKRLLSARSASRKPRLSPEQLEANRRRFEGLWRCNARLIDSWRAKGVKAAARNRSKRAVISLVLGKILPYEWYRVDHENRTITGPFPTKAEAEGRKPQVAVRRGGARHGWADLPAAKAAILVTVVTEGLCNYQIAQRLGFSTQVVRTLMNQMFNAGLVDKTGRCQCRPTGAPGVIWRASDKALQSRGSSAVGVKGAEGRKYLEQGYTPLPARKLKEQADV